MAGNFRGRGGYRGNSFRPKPVNEQENMQSMVNNSAVARVQDLRV